MVELYAKLIINQRRTFEEVPTGMQPAVAERLQALGYDQSGHAIEV